MESFFTRYKNPLILIVILLAQTIGLAIQVPRRVDPSATDPRSISLMRYWVVSIVTPFERFFNGIGYYSHHGWSNYIDLRHVRQQNADLRQQLADMRLQQAAVAQDALQGHRLQALLAFQQHYVAHTVAAQVIGTSGSDLSRVIYIDKGREDGLKPDQAVITPDGIVGKVRDVFPHTAQVLLIDDQASGAGVLLASSRIRAIIHGTTGARIVITNLTPDSRIHAGETVLTSGGDQVYPRGLPVGTIESIADDPNHQPYTMIHVRPAANLSQLEEVLVITATQPDLPLSAKQDLEVGAATAEAQQAAAALAAQQKAIQDAKTAAEIVADRLPSLHDSDNANAPKDPNAPIDPNAAAKAPRPSPPISPDRYSPGSTPAATDLTPGAAHPHPASNPTTTPQPSPNSTQQRTTPSTNPDSTTNPAPTKPRSQPTTPSPTTTPNN
jgi:rod shape-determining protein MreC